MESEKCPDCGAPLNVNETREIGREIHKEEVAMQYLDRPKEYAKLPPVLGRKIGPWRREEACSECCYQATDGNVTRDEGVAITACPLEGR